MKKRGFPIFVSLLILKLQSNLTKFQNGTNTDTTANRSLRLYGDDDVFEEDSCTDSPPDYGCTNSFNRRDTI